MKDDDYYYYVKAVPKALVATSERSIKKINGESAREERKSAERVVNCSTPLFRGRATEKEKKGSGNRSGSVAQKAADIDDIDFEKSWRNPLKDFDQAKVTRQQQQKGGGEFMRNMLDS